MSLPAALIGTLGWGLLLLQAAPGAPRGGPPSPRDQVIHFYVAASVEGPCRAAARVYESRHPGVTVKVRAEAPARLANEILGGGRRPDLILLAGEEAIGRLVAAGVVAEETRVVVATNHLVVIGRSDVASHLDSLPQIAAPEVRAVAICDSLDPLFDYANNFLLETGLWFEMRERIVRVPDVRAAVAAVEDSVADYALVYATEARNAKKVRVVWTPDAFRYGGIPFPVAMLQRSSRRPAATEFYRFLLSQAAARIFTAHGYHHLLLQIDPGPDGD